MITNSSTLIPESACVSEQTSPTYQDLSNITPRESPHFVFVGISTTKFTQMVEHAKRQCGYRISYIVTTAADAIALSRDGAEIADIHLIDGRGLLAKPSNDHLAYIASLEQPGITTVHNMIRGDPYLKDLPYSEAINYAVHLALNLQSLFRLLKPSAALAGHDRMLAAMSAAVARHESVPWFSLSFSVLPVGYVAVSERVVPDELVLLSDQQAARWEPLALELLTQFEQRSLKAPAYVSAHTTSLVLRRLGFHALGLLTAVRRRYGQDSDRFNRPAIKSLISQYLRKRINMFSFPRHWFLTEPPKDPYIFFGLHMQPESSIDVYAPYFSNQLDTVEKIARAVPPTHKLLMKLHISDADNYSRKQLRWLRALPGVQLVLPTAWSRPFLDQCSAVVTISGTMGLEGALLGKPVISLGRMAYASFPTVKRVGDLHELSEVIRHQLAVSHPGRIAIIKSYAQYLSHFTCLTGPDTMHAVNDWTNTEPTADELRGFPIFLRGVEEYIKRHHQVTKS
jgi:hypothetical protein